MLAVMLEEEFDKMLVDKLEDTLFVILVAEFIFNVKLV